MINRTKKAITGTILAAAVTIPLAGAGIAATAAPAEAHRWHGHSQSVSHNHKGDTNTINNLKETSSQKNAYSKPSSTQKATVANWNVKHTPGGMTITGKLNNADRDTTVTLRASAKELKGQGGWYKWENTDRNGNFEISLRKFDNTNTRHWQLELGKGTGSNYGDVLASGSLKKGGTASSKVEAKPVEPKPTPVKPTPAPTPKPTPEPVKPAPVKPAPTTPGTVKGTNGSGGAIADSLGNTWSNGKVSSNYHVYAGHLKGKEPVGVIFYLHGDGGWEYKDQKYSPTREYIKVARDNNMLLVVPKTPDSGGTWWKKDSSGDWAAGLLDHMGTKYNLNLNKTYWVGFSGGADTVAEQIVNAHTDGWTGGAAIMNGGGSMWHDPDVPVPASLKKSFPMYWVVGSEDTKGKSGMSAGGYDALNAAKRAHATYTKHGMDTTLKIIPGANHVDAGWEGPKVLRQVIAAQK